MNEFEYLKIKEEKQLCIDKYKAFKARFLSLFFDMKINPNEFELNIETENDILVGYLFTKDNLIDVEFRLNLMANNLTFSNQNDNSFNAYYLNKIKNYNLEKINKNISHFKSEYKKYTDWFLRSIQQYQKAETEHFCYRIRKFFDKEIYSISKQRSKEDCIEIINYIKKGTEYSTLLFLINGQEISIEKVDINFKIDNKGNEIFVLKIKNNSFLRNENFIIERLMNNNIYFDNKYIHFFSDLPEIVYNKFLSIGFDNINFNKDTFDDLFGEYLNKIKVKRILRNF